MRNLLALVAFLAIAFGVVGYYRGWYTFEVTKGPDGHRTINVDVDAKKIQTDEQKVEKAVTGK